MAVYIGHSVHREPLDQTDLKDDVDASQEVVQNRHCDAEADSGPQGLGVLQVGLGGPTWQPPTFCFGGLPSGVFQSLPTSVSLWINVICFDEQALLDGFLSKSSCNTDSPKLVEFISLNP